MTKISIRFYNDHEVRALWDEDNSKWWFSAVDIISAITESPNPRKYWSVMKTRLKKSNSELTTNCSQLHIPNISCIQSVYNLTFYNRKWTFTIPKSHIEHKRNDLGGYVIIYL